MTSINDEYSSQLTDLDIRFALKIRLNNRFTKQQRLFMIEIFFKEQNNPSEKKSPNLVEELSKKQFLISKRLKASQIKSYFSNLSKDIAKPR